MRKRWVRAGVGGLILGMGGWVMGAEPGGGAGPATRPKVVYANGFEKEAGKEWSKNGVDTTPDGERKYLGPFGNETVRLKLEGLPAHRMVRVSFELFIMHTWDGPDAGNGPDIWELGLRGGPTLLRTTFQFNGAPFRQSYPGEYPYDSYPAGTSAAEKCKLGFPPPQANPGAVSDAVYRIVRTIPHTGPQLEVEFRADLHDAIRTPVPNETWGLDDVKVEVLEAPLPLTPREMKDLFEEMGANDAGEAQDALWFLVAGGELARVFLAEQLGFKPLEGTAAAKLVGQLDSDDLATRDAATRELEKIGPAGVGFLREAMKTASAEVRHRLESVIEKLEKPEVTPQLRRARKALEVLSWESARQ